MHTELDQKPQRLVSIQRCKHGWDDIIKMDLKLIWLEN
jgi:hypothetical protein